MTRIYNYGDIDEKILKYANAYIKQVVNNLQKNYFRDKLKHTRFNVSFEEYNDNINYNMNEINEFKIYLQFFEINKKRINIESKILYDGIKALTTKQRDTEAYDISQEDLVVASLRFNPDIVVVGEIRDFEAYSAVEASLTGHTVVSTIHASAADAAHTRLALLCQKKFPINFNTSLMQAAQAFPIVVFEHKLEDNSRRIMDISECVVHPNGEREYRTLYKYNITKNEIVDGKYIIEGHFEQPSIMSEYLKKKLMQFGVPQDVLEKFLIKENECAFK